MTRLLFSSSAFFYPSIPLPLHHPSIPPLPLLLHPSFIHLQVDVEKLQRDFEQAHLVQWLEKAVIDRLKAAQVESILSVISMFMILYTHMYMACSPPSPCTHTTHTHHTHHTHTPHTPHTHHTHHTHTPHTSHTHTTHRVKV